jgi:5-formyltetrahydrofolate cyclo-ligase
MRYHPDMAQSRDAGDAKTPQGAALREAKLALRAEIVARRDALPDAFRRSAAMAIAARIGTLPQFTGANTVLLTLPFRSEWNTLPLVHAAIAAGKLVAAPRVDAATRMLELHVISDPARDIVAGFQGIPEPRPDCPPVPRAAIDFVLVPGVAFDRAGGRLGYGGGYYDRLLPLLSPGAPRVSGAFEIQVADRVPVAPHDATVDTIATEARLLEPGR